ncbi:VOC family protein [Nitrosococcus watsonii]|uniref:Glyoxalase/bleomycin resistance protein/dioxygenase n=1 Tax=Nitrosococcus watsoni (strain C-113) TaxID=105559 RepID=D8KAI9_NITWC|nr:VOC family protein [Nitrosococcus watsonii]ADJ29416.1 Glyoxalase/bleomycin resistance protein/dioxygenase [Nitrosococcus watsonii C-113]
MRGRVQRLLRVSRNALDLVRAMSFYRDALGFSLVSERPMDDPAWSELMGLPGTGGRSAILQLGEQTLELVAFDPLGRAYPSQSRASDHWFQHLAIVVADMEAAYANLCRHFFTTITTGGPQQLPPNAGSVTALKFRDPVGHPLELLHFPSGGSDARWQQKRGGHDVFLGIDHSAITVADITESIDFYTCLLGFQVAARSLNSGPEQAHLDNAPGVRVEVVALQPEQAGPPHLELLGYERPAGHPIPAGVKAHDLLADRLILEVDDLPSLAQAIEGEGIEFISPGIVTLRDGHRAALLRDPTGHMLMLYE